MDIKTQFKPSQIVCLEHKNYCLYGEVVQVITNRELCWVRPLILAELSVDSQKFESFISDPKIVDVRLTSDLIFPIKFFRAALDVEVMPILTHLEKMDLTSEKIQRAKYELQGFIKGLWIEN